MNGKVLITGAFGNLGSWITKYLVQNDFEIILLTRREKKIFEDIEYKVVECDITNLNELKNKLNFNIDYCVHLASYNEFFHENYLEKALEINTLGTRNLLEVLSKKNLKNFIYFSTFHIYGKDSGLISEEISPEPKNDYALTHLFAEYFVKQFHIIHNIPYTILRLTNSYGTPIFIDTDKWYLVLNDLCKQAFEKQEIVLKSNGKVKRDFIWMGDVSKVVTEILKAKPTNDVYNLSSGKSYEVLDLAQKVKKSYYEKYDNNVDIKINHNDLTEYKELFVKNEKLKHSISFEINCQLEYEINKILDLLEDQHKLKTKEKNV
jgi:UDP-glucose 4-epimerase